MNYDQPRQLKDGGWHYTRMNDNHVHAIGYCSDHGPHATEAEARDCYTGYLLTERLMLRDDAAGGDTRYRCQAAEGCGQFTGGAAMLDGWHLYWLCDEHRDREHVAALFGQAGDSIHS